MDYYIHDNDGQILMTGSCADSQFEYQIPEVGTYIKQGVALLGQQYWDDSNGLMPIPEKPSKAHTFNYKTKQWECDLDRAWELVRAERDALIAATDWTQYQDIDPAIKLYWEPYRQQLRDITNQSDPINIAWPVAPKPANLAELYPVFTGLSKLGLFTDEEQIAISQSAQQDVTVKKFYDRFLHATYLTYSDPLVEMGFSALVQAGLLTQERKDAIVQLMLPPALRG